MFDLVKKIIFAAALPLAAQAQEITLTVASDVERLEAPLKAASLTLALQGNDDVNAQDLVAAARADYRRLLTALYAAGYYAGTINIRINGAEASTIAPLDAPRQVRSVTLNVDPGPRFKFGTAQINPVPADTELPEEFSTGRSAKSDVIRSATTQTINAWRDLGYAKAAPENQRIAARHEDRKLDVDVSIETGPRLTFGALTITGDSAVRRTAIRRIAGLPVGDVFSPKELKAAEARLRRTGTFDGVAMTEAEDIGPNNTLPIGLQIKDAKPRRYGFGIELSSIEGLTVSTYWMHRNAFGGAERFRVGGEISGISGETGGIDYTLNSSLAIPAIYGPLTDFLFTATLLHEDEPDYLVDRVSIEAMLTRNIGDNLTANIGFGLLAAREETVDATRSYTLLTMPLGLEWDRRNDVANTTSGYYVDLDAIPFVGLSNSGNGARVFADARAFQTFGEARPLTLAARGQFGAVLGVDAEDAPADFLFYSGGGGTVRGQGYKTLGIETANGTRGGSSFAGAQLEARLGVNDSIGLVGFYDFGYVGSTVDFSGDDGDWHAGTGIGLRYNTGIGPIRLDIGTPATGDDAFGSVQVYIGIGQAF